jgi:hypothetical protein
MPAITWKEDRTMRRIHISYAAFCLVPLIAHAGYAQVEFGARIDDGLEGFYLAVGDYFQVPEKEVIVVREARIPDDEIPVVFFLAAMANTSPDVIIDLRLGGRSWFDITLRFGLRPDIYYVPVMIVVNGPPYGRAYGYYRKRPRDQWNRIVLSDADIVNLVNLRFLSEFHGLPPEEVIRMRSRGVAFPLIDDDIRYEKEHRDKGKSKGKGH